MSSNQNTQNSFHCLRFFDDYGVRKLLCAIIELAVLDYNLCVERGFITNKKVNKLECHNHELPKTIENLSEISSLIPFFYAEGLEMLIEEGHLQDEEGTPLSAEYIKTALI